MSPVSMLQVLAPGPHPGPWNCHPTIMVLIFSQKAMIYVRVLSQKVRCRLVNCRPVNLENVGHIVGAYMFSYGDASMGDIVGWYRDSEIQ